MTNIQKEDGRRLLSTHQLFAAVAAFSACLHSATPARPHPAPISDAPSLVRPIAPSASAIGFPWERVGDDAAEGETRAVIRVTTLDSDGPGSLRKALATAGPRLVVFEVGGVIDLGGRSLTIVSPYLTVAGQTAPDPGITLIRGSLIVETHHVVIAHLAVRPGDRGPAPAGGEWAPDALGVRRGRSGPVHHVLFDHCSATWAIDENLSASGPADVDADADADVTAHDITLRHCLIAEGLSHAGHPKGEHSKGTLIHDGVRQVAILGCLYAHNHERNPRLKGGTRTVVANNVMVDWESACLGIGARGNQRMLTPAEAVIVGNVAVGGPATKGRVFVKSVDPGGRVFLRDNLVLGAGGAPLTLADDGVTQLEAPPAWAPSIRALPAIDSAVAVLRSAGSRPARRDAIDARIVRSVIEGTGRIIDSQEEVGGYPLRPRTVRTLEVPNDPEARRRWLAALSEDLAYDRDLDVRPWRERLKQGSGGTLARYSR
jgi:hypothetical protein